MVVYPRVDCSEVGTKDEKDDPPPPSFFCLIQRSSWEMNYGIDI